LLAAPRDTYVYYPDTQSLPYFAAPKVLNRPHSITADVEIPNHGAEGVLLCQGSAAGGYTLFLQHGKLHYVHNYVALEYFRVASNDPIPSGSHALRFEFEPTGDLDLRNGKGAPGRLQLYVDGTLVGERDAPYTTPAIFNPGALACGANPGSPIIPDYAGPFPFSGTIQQVTIDVSGELVEDSETQIKVAMARQ
jgi:arylsulfatase